MKSISLMLLSIQNKKKCGFKEKSGHSMTGEDAEKWHKAFRPNPLDGQIVDIFQTWPFKVEVPLNFRARKRKFELDLMSIFKTVICCCPHGPYQMNPPSTGGPVCFCPPPL